LNQPTSQLSNQPTNQPTKQPTNHPTNQLTIGILTYTTFKKNQLKIPGNIIYITAIISATSNLIF